MSALRKARHADRFPLRSETARRFPHDVVEDRRIGEMFGFVFGDRIDDMFVEATFPPGWKFESTDALWSNLLDNNGAIRGKMFFKAAFYDYDAFISWAPRYRIEEIRPENWWDLQRGVTAERIFTSSWSWERCEPNTYVEPGTEDMFQFGYGSFAMFGSERPKPIMRKVEHRTYLPEDQQPKDIPPADYESHLALFDRKTGLTLLRSKSFVVPHHERLNHYRIEEQNKEEATRSFVAAVEEHFPNHTSMLYWFD